MIKKITNWRELSDAFLLACEWSDPATSQPVGEVNVNRFEDTVIVKMEVKIDLVPIRKL